MNSSEYTITADFLDCGGRKLFYLLLQPATVEPHSCILYLPPFAEEMHMSRHIVASQARELAARGYTVMLLDPTGCGDSGGEFVDASWQIWLDDAAFAAHTLQGIGGGPLTLWGLRLGALLACEVSLKLSNIQKLLLWQPILNGEQQIDQFLRLRSAASVLSTPLTFNRKALWAELRAGGSLEIAGYELSSELALEMSTSRLNDLSPKCMVNWLEAGTSPDGRLSVASENVLTHWQERGVQVDSRFVCGDPFWRTPDALVNADLRRNTLDLLAER
jgi:exosortase A-associated hydrolase 2